MGLVLVDLDGTLLAGASERLFIAHLARRRRLGPRQAASAAGFLMRHLPLLGARAIKLNKAYLAGLEVAEVEEMAVAFVDRTIMPRLHHPMLARLASHARQDDKVALLSGTPDFIAAPLAARLDIALWRACRPARLDGRYGAAVPTHHPFADGKVIAALELCCETGVALAECTAYANAIDDVPLLERVQRPVAVAPDRALRRVAQQQGWEILGETGRASPARRQSRDYPVAP